MTLSENEIHWLVNAAKRWRNSLSDPEVRADVSAHIRRIEEELEKPEPVLELLIICPRCFKQHVDEGEYATKPHKNHSCQFCGLTFQASGPVESVGVQFFRGYKNDARSVVHNSDKPPQVGLPSLRPGEEISYTFGSSGFKIR